MPQDELAMIFRRGMDAYNRGDYEAAVAGFAADIEWEVHRGFAPDATTYHGHEGVKRFWESWAEAFKGMALEIEECRSVGSNLVLAVTRARGMGSGSGAPVMSREFAQVAHFQGDRVVRVQLYGDVKHALEAVGVSE